MKVGFLKLHLSSEGLPYSNERSILGEFGRVVSEWVTWALLPGVCWQHHEANRNCDDRNRCRDAHIRHTLSLFQIIIRSAATCSYRLLAVLELRCLSVPHLHFYAARRADLAGGHASNEIDVVNGPPLLKPPHDAQGHASDSEGSTPAPTLRGARTGCSQTSMIVAGSYSGGPKLRRSDSARAASLNSRSGSIKPLVAIFRSSGNV